MHSKTVILVLIFWTMFRMPVISQNFVQNPSFEYFSGCPQGCYVVDSAVHWSGFRYTPDYFNPCQNPFPPQSPLNCGVPFNIAGYQMPASGNSYAGIINFDSTYHYLNLWEYLANELVSPLKIGIKYYVSFKTCLGYNPGQWGIVMATNNVGAKFTTFKAGSLTNNLQVCNYAHVNTQQIITDSVNWTTVSGSFIADSAYKYLVIGNFFDSANTLRIKLSNHPDATAYYYIDDVCVTADSLNCTEQIVTANHNYSQEDFHVRVDRYSGQLIFHVDNPASNSFDFYIFDFTGRVLFTSFGLHGQKLDIPIPHDYKGLYYYKSDFGKFGVRAGKVYID